MSGFNFDRKTDLSRWHATNYATMWALGGGVGGGAEVGGLKEDDRKIVILEIDRKEC